MALEQNDTQETSLANEWKLWCPLDSEFSSDLGTRKKWKEPSRQRTRTAICFRVRLPSSHRNELSSTWRQLTFWELVNFLVS